MKRIFLFILATAFLLPLSAQNIRRATLGSIGGSVTVDDFRITSSFGQKSIACSVVYGEGVILRQGFQQPTPELRPCEFTVAAAWEEIETACGFYYSFEYQGDVDIENASFLWDFGTDAFPTGADAANPMDIAYSTEGVKIIRLTVEQDDCSDSFEFSINAQKATFGINPEVTEIACVGQKSGSISLTSFGGEQPFVYEWSDGNTQADRQDLEAGTYAYTVTSADGCVVGGSVDLAEPDGAEVTSEITQDDCTTSSPEGSIDLTTEGATGAVEYLWSNGETTEDISGLEGAAYSVTIFDAGCETELTFVLEDCSPDGPPDVITPNGDGENDNWVIPGIENFPNNEVSVYNRWGSIVFNARPYQNDWQGTNNGGKDLVTGAYYYVVKLNDEDNTVYGGAITIVR